MSTMKIGKKFLLLSLLISVGTQQIMADMQSVITMVAGSAACGAVLLMQPHYEKYLKHGSQEEKDRIAEHAAWSDHKLLEKALQHGANLDNTLADMVLGAVFSRGDTQQAQALLKAELKQQGKLGTTLNMRAEYVHKESSYLRNEPISHAKYFSAHLSDGISTLILAYPTLQAFDPANSNLLKKSDLEQFKRDRTYFCQEAREGLGEFAESTCDSYTKLLDKITEVRKQHGFTN